MIDEILCWHCDEIMKIDIDEYYETEQEHTFDVQFCPKCDAPNSISWRNNVTFHGSEPDSNDKKDFDYKFEDNKLLLEQFELKKLGGQTE